MEVSTVFLVLGRGKLDDWKVRPPWLQGSQPKRGLNLGPHTLDRLSTLNFFKKLTFYLLGRGGQKTVCRVVPGTELLSSGWAASVFVHRAISSAHTPSFFIFIFCRGRECMREWGGLVYFFFYFFEMCSVSPGCLVEPGLELFLLLPTVPSHLIPGFLFSCF